MVGSLPATTAMFFNPRNTVAPLRPRAGHSADQLAPFRLRGVQLLREDTAEEEAAVSGWQEVVAKREPGLIFALRQADGPPDPSERESSAQPGAAPTSAPAF